MLLQAPKFPPIMLLEACQFPEILLWERVDCAIVGKFLTFICFNVQYLRVSTETMRIMQTITVTDPGSSKVSPFTRIHDWQTL